MSVTTSTKSFRDMTRREAIDLCYILEEQRDNALSQRDAHAAKVAERDTENRRLRDLLREGIAAETAPCRLDHNGDCQEHGWFGGQCWIAVVRAALTEGTEGT